MKIDKLLQHIQDNGLSLPESGTGRNGKILAKDLEATLGDYFAKLKYKGVMLQHLAMRRACQPMKAYRYTNLDEETQAHLWRDNNEWVLEEKFNGWRMVMTYIPSDGFAFWGGNISDVDFLPVDYTDHVLLNGLHPRDMEFQKLLPLPFILDSEALCHSSVEMLDGRLSSNTLDAVKAILGSGVERALELQSIPKHTLQFNIFDYIPCDAGCNLWGDLTLAIRDNLLVDVLGSLRYINNFQGVNQTSANKKQVLQNLWKNGAEGCILKNVKANYEPGSRKRNIAVKVKRTMSGSIGDDIDAFIMGSIDTKEWTKKGLIGGIKLGVFVEEGGERKTHHIATVSSMPDSVREKLTMNEYGIPLVKMKYLSKVLVVDGQELSAKNRMILHATVDWGRGFRETKSANDCTFTFDSIDNERF